MNIMKLEKKDLIGVLPIEQQFIKGKIKHVVVTIPALDERWAQERKFAFYVFPPTKSKNGSYVPGAKDAWISSMSCVLDDIWWLCELQYHKFWSQVLYNKHSVNGIKSFLHLAPLQKLYYRNKDNEILSLYKRIKKAVFQFLKRISRQKESELHFISDKMYQEIMTDHEIVPVSLLFCICSVYGEKYREAVEIMVLEVVKWNRNLKLEQAVLRTTQLFDRLNKKLKASYKELKKNLLCSDDSSDVLDATNAYKSCVVVTVQFLANASLNVSNFLSIYKGGCKIFLNHDFDFHIVRVYDKLLVPLYQEINILFEDCQETQSFSWLNSLIDILRLELTKTFEICLQTTLESISLTRISQDFIQRYVKLMKFVLKTEEFLQDLHSYCNVIDITEKIKKKCPGNLDLSDIDRVIESINELLNKNSVESLVEKRKSPDIDGEYVQWNEIIDYVKEYYDSDVDSYTSSANIYVNEADDALSDDVSSNYSEWNDDENSNSEYECYLASSENDIDTTVPTEVYSTNKNIATKGEPEICSKLSELALETSAVASAASVVAAAATDANLSQMQLYSAIAHVKDVLPHLGDGFVAMCLDYYKMDSSAVINAIFEENLPPHLNSLDFSLPHLNNDTEQAQKIASTLQNGEFNDNKLKELKKHEYSSYREMFDDKKEVSKLKNVYENYRNIEEDALYDDDVEEEFDEAPVAALEVDPEGFYNEYANLPLFNHNRPRQAENERVSDNEVPENDKQDERRFDERRPLDFCENPEVTRARRDHQRRVAEEKKHRRTSYSNMRTGGNRRESRPENFSTNEKYGRPSQNRFSNEDRPNRNEDGENVNRERHFKNVHKSRNANHNRRFLSDRKRKF